MDPAGSLQSSLTLELIAVHVVILPVDAMRTPLIAAQLRLRIFWLTSLEASIQSRFGFFYWICFILGSGEGRVTSSRVTGIQLTASEQWISLGVTDRSSFGSLQYSGSIWTNLKWNQDVRCIFPSLSVFFGYFAWEFQFIRRESTTK